MPRTEAQKRAENKHNKKTYKRYSLKLRLIDDADLIALLEKNTLRELLIKAYRK